jgi:hypothetical protein
MKLRMVAAAHNETNALRSALETAMSISGSLRFNSLVRLRPVRGFNPSIEDWASISGELSMTAPKANLCGCFEARSSTFIRSEASPPLGRKRNSQMDSQAPSE